MSRFKPRSGFEDYVFAEHLAICMKSRTPGGKKKRENIKPSPLENTLLLQIQVDPFGHNVTLCILHLNDIIP